AREWAAWAAKFGYRLDLDARAGLLLITPAGTGAIERRLQVIDSVEAWFEKLLPRPAPRPEAAEPAEPSPPPPSGALPKDPEGPPPGAPRKEPPAPVPDTTPANVGAWGSALFQPDLQTAVMLVVRDQPEYLSVLELLGQKRAFLSDWIEEARKNTGF